MGSAALALAYVGNGRFDAFIQQGGLSTWDIAAAGLIAERGGACVTAMDGGPWFEVAKPTQDDRHAGRAGRPPRGPARARQVALGRACRPATGRPPAPGGVMFGSSS